MDRRTAIKDKAACDAFWNDILHGVPAGTMTAAQQMLWWKLMALGVMAGRPDGSLRHKNKVPMSKQFICEQVGCDPGELDALIDLTSGFEEDDDRIGVLRDGALRVRGFDRYYAEAA